MTAVAVLGAGAWGAALANALAGAGRVVPLWARDATHAAEMAASRENARRLPGVRLADGVEPTSALARVGACDVILAAVPTQALREALSALAPHMRAGAAVVLCAKGVERTTSRFPTDVLAETIPAARPAILSGPSFAADVARGLPTAVTLAAARTDEAAALCALIGTRTLRPYASTDLRGVEIGGAAKNVLAIACGIASGLGLGASAVAALTTRGFAELARFGAAYGARPETLMGLSGLGDLLLTCGSPQSRNFSLGLAIGHGDPRPAALAEGAFTAPVMIAMARAKGVDMPVAAAVDDVLAGRVAVADAVETLLARPLRAET